MIRSNVDASPAAEHTADLRWRDGRTASIPVGDGETLLEAAESSGIGLPFGCRIGACGSCTGRLLDGSVDELRPQRALKPRFREKGYVLTCVTAPTSDCTIEVGPDVLEDLLENPWK